MKIINIYLYNYNPCIIIISIDCMSSFSQYTPILNFEFFFACWVSQRDSGWCPDMSSTHGVWRHTEVRFLLTGDWIEYSLVGWSGRPITVRSVVQARVGPLPPSHGAPATANTRTNTAQLKAVKSFSSSNLSNPSDAILPWSEWHTKVSESIEASEF